MLSAPLSLLDGIAELLRCIVDDRLALRLGELAPSGGDRSSAACGGKQRRRADEDRLLSGEFHEPKETSQP